MNPLSMKHVLVVIAFFLFNLVLTANNTTNTYPQDSIICSHSEELGTVYEHTMQSKQTIYGIARFFGNKPNAIYEINPQLADHVVQVEENILVPINKEIIIYAKKDFIKGERYIPIYYQAKAQDNFFRIARVYFDQTIENLLKINKVESFELEIGSILLVGWIPASLENRSKLETEKTQDIPTTTPTPITSIQELELNQKPAPEEQRNIPRFKKKVKTKQEIAQEEKHEWEKLKESIDEIIQISKTYDDSQSKKGEASNIEISAELKTEHISLEIIESNLIGDITPSADLVIKNSKGIAIWNNTGTGKHQMFALHPTAKVNSVIELQNPMMNRTVYAKVIGNIPPNTYPEEVKVIISPKTAQSLGVVDQRFFVKMRYLE